MGSNDLIVKKKQKINPTIISVLLFLAAVLITVLLFKAAGPVAFFPAPFLLVGAFLFSKYFKVNGNVEFEYSFIDGTFSITKLLNQEKRSPVIQVEVNEITGFGLATEENLKNIEQEVVKIIHCDTAEDSDTHYYFICKYNDSGVHAFVFTPDEKFLKMLSGRSQIIASSVRKTTYQ